MLRSIKAATTSWVKDEEQTDAVTTIVLYVAVQAPRLTQAELEHFVGRVRTLCSLAKVLNVENIARSIGLEKEIPR